MVKPNEISFRNSITSLITVIKSPFLNCGLQLRLTLLFTAVSLVPLLALGIFSYYKSAATIQDIIRKYINDITNEININIYLNFKNIDDISKVLLNNITIREILSKEPAAAARDYNADQSRVTSILKSIKFSNDYITSIYILATQNNNIFAVGDVTGNYGLNFLTPEYKANYKKYQLYQDTLTEYNNYKWWPPQNVLGQNVFIMTRKLYDVERGNLGVIVIHVNQKIVSNISNRLTNTKDTLIYLIDPRGQIIFHPDTALLGKRITSTEIVDAVNQSESGSFITQKNPIKLLVVFNTFLVTDWKLVASIPYHTLIAEANMIRNATLLILLICLILVLLLSYFMSRGILNPLRKLMQLMKQGATGDLKVRFQVLYRDEIGELGASFNKMMFDIEKLMQAVAREQKQKVEAEIRALEAHINPHFLYNTLASIYWLAMAEGNTKVGRMAAALSNFFKLGLNKGKEFTTIEKEVEHVRNYLSIQKMRFGGKFNYQIQVHPQALPYRTIKFILQPLVENALVHGIEELPDTGLIKVTVAKAEERIVFRVSDNGLGIAHSNETELQEIINAGYGLKNIRERLGLYFENDYTFNCVSIPKQETTFEISIPARIVPEGEENV